MPTEGANNQRELTAHEVQLIRDLLLPAFKDAMREPLHSVRKDFTGSLDALKEEIQGENEKFDARLTKLERVAFRALLVYGAVAVAVSAVASILFAIIKSWVMKKYGM